MSKHEKKDKTKSKVQFTHWKTLFQPGSNLDKFSQAMIHRGGMSVKDFNKLLKKTGGSASYILRSLRKGFSSKGSTWNFDDSGNRYRITNVKLHRKGV